MDEKSFLDEKDIQIISILSQDSRVTLSYLAEKINTSVPTIKSRIDKLLGLGIIDKFSIVLNYDLISTNPSYFIIIKTTPSNLTDIISSVIDDKELLEIHELVTSNQILVKTLPLDRQKLQVLLQRYRSFDGILDLIVYPIAQTHKQDLASVPSQVSVRLRCEYCSKPIERDFQTLTIEGITHYYCCTSCTHLAQLNYDENKVSSK